MTVYVFLRLSRGLGGPARVWLPLWLGAVGMMLLPMLLHRLDGRLRPLAGRCLAGSAWTWLVLVFWAFCLFLAADLWDLCLYVADGFRSGLAAYRIPPRAAAFGVLGALPVLCLWGWVQGGSVALRTVRIETPKLAAGASLRLVLIADMHLGLTTRPSLWGKVLEIVRAARPDVLVSTGDLIDSPAPFLDGWLGELAGTRSPLGKYAVLGNHEYYADVQRATDLLAGGGFTLLRGAVPEPCPGLVLAGVDDAEAGRHGGSGAAEPALLPLRRPGAFVVLLKHRPVVSAAARQQADLQISGHTHGGQVFPFGWVVRMVYPYPHGRLVAFPEGLRLYVSRGTGTWGPPFRFLVPAEVTLFLIQGSGTAPEVRR
jgi:predicted MPP superfamily phosphohydrolase